MRAARNGCSTMSAAAQVELHSPVVEPQIRDHRLDVASRTPALRCPPDQIGLVLLDGLAAARPVMDMGS